MFGITLAERKRASSELQKIRAKMDIEVLEIFRGFVTVAYINVVENTPQWTGHATAQWNIGVNFMDMSYSSLYEVQNAELSAEVRREGERGGLHSVAKQVGDLEAITEAKQRQTGEIEQVQLNSIIFISNNVESLLKESYASKLEENPNRYLRDVNEGGHMVARTIEWFNSRLALVDPVARVQLAKVRLSASGIMESF